MNSRFLSAALAAALLAGCALLPPPGSDFPKAESFALERPEQTRLGRQSRSAASAHPGNSGFRVLTHGVDGFLTRVQMIDGAERTLDLQYYIFRSDNTGKLLAEALLRAADRGTRVRVLIDDGDTVGGDERIAALASHPRIEIRVFNPFAYRGHAEPLRLAEFVMNPRLDHRMHNKLLVADNAVALTGGRNIGDAYFQVDSEVQFDDYDLFVVGPVVRQLSASFDDYWNSALAIPARGLAHANPSPPALDETRRSLSEHRAQMRTLGAGYMRHLATGEPFASMMTGKTPLVWARAEVISDAPDKGRAASGASSDRPIDARMAKALAELKSELLMVTPFFVPGENGMQALTDARRRKVRVRILTNSLESTSEVLAHSGYMRYRVPVLESGMELYELRPVPGKPQARGDRPSMPAARRSALHAKVYVFDRERLYVGSMNFDRRSFQLNTEIGLLIHSPELAKEAAARFEAMANPGNSYQVALRKAKGPGGPRLRWRAESGGRIVEYDQEPDRTERQLPKAQLLSLLPLEGEL